MKIRLAMPREWTGIVGALAIGRPIEETREREAMKSIRSMAAFTLAAMASFSALAATGAAQDDSGALYTRCNIWYEKSVISSINYKVGTIIPAGSEVRDVQLIERGRVRKVREIVFTVVESGATFAISYETRYNPNLSIAEVRDRFISKKTLEELTEGMSEKELECIKTGVLREGISKEAVLIAYGYPPSHQTPSIEANAWKYWTNRYRERMIYFDANGKTSRGRVIESDELPAEL